MFATPDANYSRIFLAIHYHLKTLTIAATTTTTIAATTTTTSATTTISLSLLTTITLQYSMPTFTHTDKHKKHAIAMNKKQHLTTSHIIRCFCCGVLNQPANPSPKPPSTALPRRQKHQPALPLTMRRHPIFRGRVLGRGARGAKLVVVVVTVVVVGMIVGIVGSVRVVIVAQTWWEALGGGEPFWRLLLTVAGTLALAIVVRRTCNDPNVY